MATVSVRYIVNDIEAAVSLAAVRDKPCPTGAAREGGARFRNDIVVGRGGKQILLDDPSGNCVELFEASSQK